MHGDVETQRAAFDLFETCLICCIGVLGLVFIASSLVYIFEWWELRKRRSA